MQATFCDSCCPSNFLPVLMSGVRRDANNVPRFLTEPLKDVDELPS